MVPFDLLLTLVGFVLIGIGVYVFLSGRKRSAQHEGESNQFEAFGIRIAVSNPAVLLIMFGVVLVLTPRFMPGEGRAPELAGAIDQVQSKLGFGQEQVEPATPTESEPPPTVAVEALASVEPTPAPVAPPPPPVQVPASRETAVPVTPAPSKPQPIEPPQQKSEPVAIKKPAVKQPAKPAAPAEVAVATTPTPAPVPVPMPAGAKPALRTAVLTDATASVEGVSASVYRQKMKQELDQVAKELLSGEVTISGANPGFRKALRLGRMQDFCRQWQVDAIFYAEVEPAAFEIGVESGNWPDATFVLADCDKDEVRESKPVGLSPSQHDQFPFDLSLIRAARGFYTQHLGLLEP